MGTMEIILSIASVLLGGTSIYTVIENIKYRKENKDLKKLEVEKSSIEAKGQELDLVTKYKENTMKMMDELQKTYDAILKNGNDNSEIIKKIDALNQRIDILANDVKEVKEEQKIQKIYLNGEYAAFRKMYMEIQAEKDNKIKKVSSDKKSKNKTKKVLEEKPEEKPVE